MDNPRHTTICKQLGHAVRLHTGHPMDSGRHIPLHSVNSIALKVTPRARFSIAQKPPPPPCAWLLCSLCPWFKKRWMLWETSSQNMATFNAKCFGTWHLRRSQGSIDNMM